VRLEELSKLKKKKEKKDLIGMQPVVQLLNKSLSILWSLKVQYRSASLTTRT
jgi:hypothetical protein